MARKAFIIIGVLVVIGVAIGVIVAVTSGKSNDKKASNQSPDGNKFTDANSTVAATVGPSANVSDESLIGAASKNGSGSGTAVKKIKEPTSDPSKIETAFTMLAIGDWGATTDKPGSCCNKYRKTAPDSLDMKKDYWAQINVAEILAKSAGEIKPVRVIGHGDNIYWNGAGPGDIDYRMEATFEEVYKHPSLAGIPWINVVGNHDLGGSEYICGEKDYQFRECKSTAEMLDYLDKKFTLQQKYQSPNNDRWQLRDHYYVEKVEKNGVSVDIFNIDTNLADSHGAMQVCCQCYGYVRKEGLSEDKATALAKTCNDQKPGDKLCAGGSMEMYNACYNRIKTWHDDSMTKIQKDLKASTATWKIVNSHYSPHFHMNEDMMKAWYTIMKENNVHVWFNGHTHGFNHDIAAWGSHFYENGGGGGIQSETSGLPPAVAEKFVKHAWVEGTNAYGFLELHFSKDWLKTQFVTFDDAWVFSKVKEEIKVGGSKKGHCWHVPVTLGEGRECAK